MKFVEIINGKKPQDMPIGIQEDTQLVINETAAKKLNISIPEDLLKSAKIVK
jgi:putative ABC transport system substrate-binding protein